MLTSIFRDIPEIQNHYVSRISLPLVYHRRDIERGSIVTIVSENGLETQVRLIFSHRFSMFPMVTLSAMLTCLPHCFIFVWRLCCDELWCELWCINRSIEQIIVICSVKIITKIKTISEDICTTKFRLPAKFVLLLYENIVMSCTSRYIQTTTFIT